MRKVRETQYLDLVGDKRGVVLTFSEYFATLDQIPCPKFYTRS